MGFKGVYNGLIPARFLTLLAHVLILIILLWDQERNLQLCLVRYDENIAIGYQNEYVLSIGLSLGFALFELVGFLAGISMFSAFHSFSSILFHCAATVVWCISFFDRWNCSTPFYWWIFSLGSPLPFVTEVVIFLRCIFRH